MADTVHVYLFDGYADWEIAFLGAGIANPQFQRDPGRWRLRTVAAAPGSSLRSMAGLTVLPDLGVDAVTADASFLFVLPGGAGWEDPAEHRAAVEVASRLLRTGGRVAAICGATAGLARAGLLDARPHTSNAQAYLKGVEGYAGAAQYVDQPAVRGGALITAGGMAPLEFSREVFALLELYDDEALDAWYQLYKTGKSEWFARMARAAD